MDGLRYCGIRLRRLNLAMPREPQEAPKPDAFAQSPPDHVTTPSPRIDADVRMFQVTNKVLIDLQIAQRT
jgi:hypothetical protein